MKENCLKVYENPPRWVKAANYLLLTLSIVYVSSLATKAYEAYSFLKSINGAEVIPPYYQMVETEPKFFVSLDTAK